MGSDFAAFLRDSTHQAVVPTASLRRPCDTYGLRALTLPARTRRSATSSDVRKAAIYLGAPKLTQLKPRIPELVGLWRFQ